jgi:lipoyl(octanoyl) transferase
MPRPLSVVSHDGFVPYDRALEAQLSCVDKIYKDKSAPYELHFLEHRHVLTLGRCFEGQHLVMGRDALAQRGVDVVDVSRGGSVTYHGPGQLVAYVHVHLKELGVTLTGFLRDLEQWVIDFLNGLNIDADRRSGMTGVWTPKGKICAMGIAAKKYVTYHGIGFNFAVDMDCFSWIVPCGLSEPVASLDQLLEVSMSRSEVERGMLACMPSWLAGLEPIGN